MRKLALIIVFLQLFLASCWLFEKQEVDASEFKINYANTENKKLEKNIKDWWNYVLNETKIEFQKNVKEWIQAKEPKIYSDLKVTEWKWIKNLVYKVYKKVWLEEENIVKVFYLKWWKEILKNEILNISDENLKSDLITKLIEKIKRSGFGYKDSSILRENLNKNILFQYFYLKDNKIIFIFDQWLVWDKKYWNIEITFNFEELTEFLNKNTFPELKNTIKRKNFYKDFEKQKANWKYDEITKDFNNGKKYVALTFDDGPSSKTTPQLLDILKRNNVKATFFLLWKNAWAYPEIVKRELEEGHEIASHSWDHPSFLTLSKNAIKKQIESTDNAIKEVTWKKADLFRPPYWAQNSTTNNLVWKTIVMWDVDSMDWKNRNVAKNISTTMSQVKNWSIILYHDIHQTSVDTIGPLIKELKSKWYEFLTVWELLKIWQWDYSKKICYWEFNCKNY